MRQRIPLLVPLEPHGDLTLLHLPIPTMSAHQRDSRTPDASSPEVEVVRAVKQEEVEWLPVARGTPPTIRIRPDHADTNGTFKRLLSYCYCAVTFALKYLKPAVKYSWVLILGCWLLLVAAAEASHGVASMQGALYAHVPLACELPLIPTGLLCVPSNVSSGNRPQAVDFSQLMRIEAEFLQAVFDEAAGISAGVWDMSRAQIAAGSLLRLIKASDFPSKGRLSSLIEEWEVQSDNTGVALVGLYQQFESCVQTTINVNDFALRTIAADRGTFLERYLPGYNGRVRPIVRESFALSLDVFSDCLGGVFVAAQDAAVHLSGMNGTLSAIHHLNSLHDASFVQRREDLTHGLWSSAGGNGGAIRNLDDHLMLVGQVSNYRMKSTLHVDRTTIAVVAIKQKLAVLRDTLATADDPYPDMTSENIQAQLYHIRATIALVLDLLKVSRTEGERLRTEALREAGVCQ